MNWKDLQNGSDIRGIALEGVQGEEVNLSAKTVNAIAKAFIMWLTRRNWRAKQKIALGSDTRLSGETLRGAFAKGAAEAGAEVLDFGIASTPAMFMATIDEDLGVNGAVMITASHLPWNRNGLKFFVPEGGLDKEDIKEIIELASLYADQFKGSNSGNIKQYNFMQKYSQNLAEYIRKGVGKGDKPLEGIKIIVDAGNGAGGFYAQDVLKQLGANTEGSLFLEPDGHFPNHIPNPENEQAMTYICKAVKENNADLGIIFDTDVDRAAIVDNEGNPINRNSLIALISKIVLKEHPNSIIVTDSVTSDGLSEIINNNGGTHLRFKRGYKNVINEAIRQNNMGLESWLAIETSGHAALRENYFLDDGAYLVSKLIVEAARLKAEGKKLQNLIEELKIPVESKEIRFNIDNENFKDYGQKVLESLTNLAQQYEHWTITKPNYEGVRIKCNAPEEKGWLLLRQSLHDPVLPLNIESDVQGGVEKIEKKIMKFINEFQDLKLT